MKALEEDGSARGISIAVKGIVLLLVVPALYVLSTGPVVHVHANSPPVVQQMLELPIEIFYAPLIFLTDEFPVLEDLMLRYTAMFR